jgi:hypothetical protein
LHHKQVVNQIAQAVDLKAFTCDLLDEGPAPHDRFGRRSAKVAWPVQSSTAQFTLSP